MEVHHHSHHPKSWKEYLQEFFMLFFAVFLGFMSEYYLEYRAERHKEHDYLNGMALDLKSDIEEMSLRIKGMEQIKMMGNHLEKLLYKSNFSDADIDSIYRNSVQITATIIVPNFSSGTIEQLKNAGGFRLIKNQDIVRKISDYERWKKTITIQENMLENHWVNVHQMQNKILHNTVFETHEKFNDFSIDRKKLNEIKKSTGSVFLTTDRKTFYEYANYIWVLKGYVAYDEIMIKMEKQHAEELLEMIEHELAH